MRFDPTRMSSEQLKFEAIKYVSGMIIDKLHKYTKPADENICTFFTF